jgi:hypothetical protein
MERFVWATRPSGLGNEAIPRNPQSGRESIVKAIAQLHEDFARIEKMRTTEGKAIVEKHAAIGDVDGLEIHGKALPELPAER